MNRTYYILRAITISEKRGYEFEREQGEIYGSLDGGRERGKML